MRRSILLATIIAMLMLSQIETAVAEREPVREWFEPESGCDGWHQHITDEGIVQLVWEVGEDAMLAAEQRAEALGAAQCSGWQEGARFLGNDVLEPENNPQAESADLTLEVEGTGDTLDIHVGITPLEDIPASINLRLLVTVDHPEGGPNAHFVVRHYHWSSSFHREAGNMTDWNYSIDAARMTEDGIPFTDDDLWRLNVVVILVDDLDHSIHASTKSRITTPSSAPTTAEAAPAVLLGLAIGGGLAAIVLSERRREIGLPQITGAMMLVKDEWLAKVEVRAGIHDMVLKGANAEPPWRMVKPPRGHRLEAGELRTYEVRLRCSTEVPEEALTHWECDVEELGGWVLDLRLPPKTEL